MIDVLKQLIEAIHVLKDYKQADWESLGEGLNSDLTQILTLLRSTDYTDEQIYNSLYSSGDRKTLYKNKKYKLLNILSRVLASKLEAPAKNRLQKERYKVHIKYHCMNLLKDLNLSHAAIWFASTNINDAIRLELTGIVVDTSRYLSRYYSGRVQKPKLSLKYGNISTQYHELISHELEIENIYNLIISNQTNTTALKKIGDEIVVPDYNPDFGQISYLYALQHGLVRIHIAEIQSNFIELVQFSEYYYLQFERKKYDHKAAKGAFLTAKVRAQLQLRQYEEAQETLKLLFTKVNPDSNNWIHVIDMQIRLSLATQDYNAAYEQITKLFQYKRYASQPEQYQDLYELYALYINFLVRTGHVVDATPWSKRKTTTYFRSTKVFDRDTRGLYVAMIIGELLYNILEQDYESMEHKIHSLKEYCSRYLKKNNENYRSNCFIKMLLEIPKANFHPVAAKRKAEKYHQKLLNHPLEMAMQSIEIEIIPFDQLWDIIIQFLRSPKRARKNAMQLSEFNL